MRSIPSDFGCDEISPMLFAMSSIVCSQFSENDVKAFDSEASFFAGDACADDDSPPDDDLFVLLDLAGDDFDDDLVDGGLRFVFVGVFFTGDVFAGDNF